jgi:hypothetical protein
MEMETNIHRFRNVHSILSCVPNSAGKVAENPGNRAFRLKNPEK